MDGHRGLRKVLHGNYQKRRFKRTNLNKNAIKISHKRMYPPLK
jgi:hypothetical protein